jgi:hypothetical protein
MRLKVSLKTTTNSMKQRAGNRKITTMETTLLLLLVPLVLRMLHKSLAHCRINTKLLLFLVVVLLLVVGLKATGLQVRDLAVASTDNRLSQQQVAAVLGAADNKRSFTRRAVKAATGIRIGVEEGVRIGNVFPAVAAGIGRVQMLAEMRFWQGGVLREETAEGGKGVIIIAVGLALMPQQLLHRGRQRCW